MPKLSARRVDQKEFLMPIEKNEGSDKEEFEAHLPRDRRRRRCVCLHINVKCVHGCQRGAAWYKAGPTKLEQQWLELRRSFAASGLRTMYGK